MFFNFPYIKFKNIFQMSNFFLVKKTKQNSRYGKFLYEGISTTFWWSRSPYPDGWFGQCRKDHHLVQIPLKRNNLYSANDRFQCGNGPVQEHCIHCLGYRWSGILNIFFIFLYASSYFYSLKSCSQIFTTSLKYV